MFESKDLESIEKAIAELRSGKRVAAVSYGDTRIQKARNNRQFINGVFWILSTGSPLRDLPSCYGDWKNTHLRFSGLNDDKH